MTRRQAIGAVWTHTWQRGGAGLRQALPTSLATTLLTALAIVGSSAAGLGVGAARAEVYLRPEVFLQQAFDSAVPAPSLLWLTAELQQRVRGVLGHPYKQLRLRYWRQGQRSAWLLDEIGKEEEITIGFVIADGQIERTQVLEFRESRGWEIRSPGFTRQLQGARLKSDGELDRRIDGITGATLSVDACRRLARLALLLHAEVTGAAR